LIAWLVVMEHLAEVAKVNQLAAELTRQEVLALVHRLIAYALASYSRPGIVQGHRDMAILSGHLS
jgi:hypothetical protein